MTPHTGGLRVAHCKGWSMGEGDSHHYSNVRLPMYGHTFINWRVKAVHAYETVL